MAVVPGTFFNPVVRAQGLMHRLRYLLNDGLPTGQKKAIMEEIGAAEGRRAHAELYAQPEPSDETE